MPGVTTAYQTGDHASRPANGAGCILYRCTTHDLIYRDDGTTWITWATLGTAGAYAPGGTDVAVADGGTGASTASAARANLGALADTDAITYLDGTVAAAPATPAAGKLRIYAKTGKVLAVKDDAGLETVLGVGIADQGAFTYLDATEVAAPATPATGKVRIYAKADGRVYSKDDAGVEYGPFSSGGGALTGERKPWDVAANYPLHTDGSEFEYADLTAFDAFWTRRNVATTDMYFPPGSQSEFRFDAQGDWIYRAWPGANPSDVKVVAEVSENRDGDGNMFGVGIVDTNGDGVGFVCYSGNFYQIALDNFEYLSLGNTGNPSAAEYDEFMNGGHAFMVLERISSTQYQGGVSLPSNGTTITHRPTAVTPTAFTPAWFGIVRAFSSGKAVWRGVHRINLYTSTFP